MNLNYFDTVKLTGRMFTLIGNVSKPSLPQAHKRCSKVTPVCTRVNRHRGNAHTHTHTGTQSICIHTRFTIYGEFDSGTYARFTHTHASLCNTNQQLGTLDSSTHHFTQHLRNHLTPLLFSYSISKQFVLIIGEISHG